VEDEGDSEDGEHFLCEGHCGDWSLWMDSVARDERG
jgi:hypothetical protein